MVYTFTHFPLFSLFLIRLMYLYLGGNRLHHIPPEIGNLTNLSALVLCGNQLQFLPREVNKLKNLRALQLHDNQLQTLPPGTVHLDNLEELSLRNNPLVLRFVREWSDTVPSLLELSGRIVKRYRLDYDPSTVPETLCDFLDSCLTCDNPTCEGVYFLHKVKRVKFVDFCGKYRVPLMQYLCSSMCDDPDDSSSATSGSEDDVADKMAQNRIRKVLLG